MKSKVLKIIIIIAFVGILSVVGVVLINNHNIEDKGYNTIVEQNKTVDFDYLTTRAGQVSTTYNGTADEYATYTTKAFISLNNGIEYYFNYFDHISGMSRQTKDNLVKLNKAYVDQAKVALNKLDTYLLIAGKSSSSITASEKEQIPALSAGFIKEFVNAYSKGSAYFKALQSSISSLIYGNKYYKDFTAIKYEMTNIFADKSISFVKENMEKRGRGEAVSRLSMSNQVSNFLKLYDKTVITPSNEQTTPAYASFINNYNNINAAKFLDDTAVYIAGLNEEQKAIATSVKNFLTNTNYYGLYL